MSNVVRVRGFPRAGISHPVAKLSSYVKFSVTVEEREMIIAHRKTALKDLHDAEVYKAARKTALNAYYNYTP